MSARQILSKSLKPRLRYGDFSIFQDRGRPPSWIFYACWDHPRRVFGGLCDCVKLGCNRCCNFDSMQILILHVKLENAHSRPKNKGFGGFYPQNGEQYERDPQKAHPWAETRRMTYRSSNRSTCAGSARAEE